MSKWFLQQYATLFESRNANVTAVQQITKQRRLYGMKDRYSNLGSATMSLAIDREYVLGTYTSLANDQRHH